MQHKVQMMKELQGLTIDNFREKWQRVENVAKQQIEDRVQNLNLKMLQLYTAKDYNEPKLQFRPPSVSLIEQNQNDPHAFYEKYMEKYGLNQDDILLQQTGKLDQFHSDLSPENSTKRLETQKNRIKQNQEEILVAKIKQRDEAINYKQIYKIHRENKFKDHNVNWYMSEVMSSSAWSELKQAFENVNTFGNGVVKTKQFLHRIQRSKMSILNANTICYPLINRTYSLKKILFNVTNKRRMEQELKWQKFQDYLTEYKNEQKPQLDEIFQRNSTHKDMNFCFNNGFLISQPIIRELKSIFSSCQDSMFFQFVDTTALVTKLYDSTLITNKFKQIIRPASQPSHLYQIQHAVEQIREKSPAFLDLDQFLEYFSIKGSSIIPKMSDFESNQSTEQKDQVQNKSLQRIKSESYLNPSKVNIKGVNPNEIDYLKKNIEIVKGMNPKEVPLVKNDEEQKQLKYKFKARAVPKSNSKEKYQQFIKQIEERKKREKENLERAKSEDQKRIQYLKSQTKLFHQPAIRKVYEENIWEFKHRDVPDYVNQPLMSEIKKAKELRKQNLLQEVNRKYSQYWQNLPEVANPNLHYFHHDKCAPSKNINQKIFFVKPTPNYRQKHTKLELELQERKNNFFPTKTQPFHFHTEDRHPQNQHQFTEPSSLDREEKDYFAFRKIVYSPQPQIYYTKKYSDMVLVKKQRILQNQKKINQKLHEEKQRRKKKENFLKFMKKNMSPIPDRAKILSNEAKFKIEKHKKLWKILDKEHDEQLNKIYENILKRPFLYQLQGPNHKKKAKKRNEKIQTAKHKINNKENHKAKNKIVEEYYNGYSDLEEEKQSNKSY